MGWRRALCTSVRRDPHPTKQQQQHGDNSNNTYGSSSPSPSPRSCGKLSFFSTAGNLPPPPPPSASAPTTPALRCRTKPPPPPHAKCQHQPEAAVSSRTPAPATPKKRLALLQALSAPSSPRSPSRFQLLKASLLLTKTRCGICAHSISKNGGGGAVFTGECSHSFHFPCIAAHVRSSYDAPSCPVCSTPWRHPPPFLRLPASSSSSSKPIDDNAENRSPHKARTAGGGRGGAPEDDGRKNKVYDDDEPLLPSKAANAGGFNPIPEADEDDGDGDDTEGGEEFRGFFPHPTAAAPCPRARGGLAVSVVPEAALVSSGRRHGKYVVAVRVKAPGVRSSASARRAPIDLVTVLDVSQGMTGEKLQMLKRGMRLVIASLGPADRLSIVAFSGAAKRLQPLRRMSRQGQRSARQIVDRLVVCAAAQGQDQAQSTCVGDALRKATKVLEDRRERNPVATIMLLSDTQQQQQQQQPQQGDHHIQQPRGADHRRPPSAPTRFTHVEIPIGSGDEPLMRSPLMPKAEKGQPQPPSAPPPPVEDAFAKCLGGLVSVVMQDVHLQLVFPSGEISAVYSCGPGQRAAALGGGGGGAAVTVRLGEMYAEEERELLVELRAPLHRQHHHPHSLSVRCSYRDPASQDAVCGAEQPLLLPPLHSGSTSQRLRDLFVATRAVAESRRLAELGDYATALHLLSSARTLLLQSRPAQPQDLIGSLDTELSDMHWRRSQQQPPPPPPPLTPTLRTRREVAAPGPGGAGGEPLTPTSAWRAAEQLAKVAIMRKSMNRVSDLHGFENARF